MQEKVGEQEKTGEGGGAEKSSALHVMIQKYCKCETYPLNVIKPAVRVWGDLLPSTKANLALIKNKKKS